MDGSLTIEIDIFLNWKLHTNFPQPGKIFPVFKIILYLVYIFLMATTTFYLML